MAERNLDFDAVVNRKNTDCLKYDFAKRRGMPEDVLPLWVADMDFKTSSYIEDAVIERTKHGIFGYSEVQTPLFRDGAGLDEKTSRLGRSGKMAYQNAGRCFCAGNGGKGVF